MGVFGWIIGGVIAVIGLAMAAFPRAFTKEPESVLVSLNPAVLIFGLVVYGAHFLFSLFPEGFKMFVVRTVGGLMILGGLGTGIVGSKPSLVLSGPKEPPQVAAPPVVEAPAPEPVAAEPPPPPAPTEAEADAHIAQASAAWRSGNVPAAVEHARAAHRIRSQILGPDHPKVKEVERMLAAAAQKVGAAR